MHARWLVPWITALALCSGCARGERAADDGARATEKRAEAPAAREAAASPVRSCVLGEPVVALASDAPVSAIGLAHGEGGTVLVGAVDEGTLEWVRLDPAGRPGQTLRAPFPRARALVAAAPWGDRTVAIGHAPCPDDISARMCLHVAALQGTRVLEALSIPLAQSVERLRLASSERLLVVARSHDEGPPYADLVRVAGGRLRAESVRLGDDHLPGERRAEVLAAAVSRERYAVAIRVGAIEDPTGALVLATGGRLFEVEELHEAAMIDALAFDNRTGELALLASFEFSRPHVFRVDARGALSREPAPVAHGAPVGPAFTKDASSESGASPGPFSEELGRLGRDSRGLWLHRASYAGDVIGEPFRVAGPEPARASIAKRDRDYLVAIAPRSAPFRVHTVAVRCGDRR